LICLINSVIQKEGIKASNLSENLRMGLVATAPLCILYPVCLLLKLVAAATSGILMFSPARLLGVLLPPSSAIRCGLEVARCTVVT